MGGVIPVPLPWLRPLRRGAVRFRRGTITRNACIALLKIFSKSRRLSLEVDEIRPYDRPMLSFEPSDSMVMDAVYWYGVQGYEGRMADLWETLCSGSIDVLEVGGNVGLFTVLGARLRKGRYTVVEPLPWVAEVLRANLARNRVTGVEVLQAAAIPEAEPAEVFLNVPAEGRHAPVGAHLVSGVEAISRTSLDVLTVDGLPFSQLAEGKDLIKIDAEGIEAALLGSAEQILANARPTIVVEVLPGTRRLAQLIARFATEYHYNIHIVPAYGSDTIVRIAAEDFDSHVPARLNSKDVVLSQDYIE